MSKPTDERIFKLAAENQQPHFDQMFDPSVSPRHRCEINEMLTNWMNYTDAMSAVAKLETGEQIVIQSIGFNYTLWLIDGKIAARVDRNARINK